MSTLLFVLVLLFLLLLLLLAYDEIFMLLPSFVHAGNGVVNNVVALVDVVCFVVADNGD